MKKRFTVMLDTNTIAKLKELQKWYSPSGIREELQRVLDDYASDEIFYHDFNQATGRYNFDDK